MPLVEINWNPGDRQLRQFAAISLFALPLAGWLWGAAPCTVWLLGGLGFALATVGWLLPRAVKPLFVVLSLAAAPIGMVVGELVMAAVFFAVFLPIGLVFRLMRRDGLQLKIDPDATTYWQSKRPPGGPASYYRQF